jgi:Pvc16 N-terminal domain
MFELLDKTLSAMLTESRPGVALPQLSNVHVSFLTPEKTYNFQQDNINLYLYETRENRELRSAAPIFESRGGLSVRRRPPLRVDCAYLVTAWSMLTQDAKVEAEHRLLGYAFNWLSRFPVVPDFYLQQGGLVGQVFEPPTLVAQLDTVKNAGEFWVSLGIPPRPFFNLIVTITMDLDQALEEFPVTTVLTTYQQDSNAASAEQRIAIGGTVRDNANQTVRDAWVRLEPAGITTVTDATGRFIFDNIAGGTGITLRARAPGKGEASTPAGFQIPSLTGNYDLQFPN